MFLDTQVSLAPTHVSKSVRPLVGDTFELLESRLCDAVYFLSLLESKGEEYLIFSESVFSESIISESVFSEHVFFFKIYFPKVYFPKVYFRKVYFWKP